MFFDGSDADSEVIGDFGVSLSQQEKLEDFFLPRTELSVNGRDRAGRFKPFPGDAAVVKEETDDGPDPRIGASRQKNAEGSERKMCVLNFGESGRWDRFPENLTREGEQGGKAALQDTMQVIDVVATVNPEGQLMDVQPGLMIQSGHGRIRGGNVRVVRPARQWGMAVVAMGECPHPAPGRCLVDRNGTTQRKRTVPPMRRESAMVWRRLPVYSVRCIAERSRPAGTRPRRVVCDPPG